MFPPPPVKVKKPRQSRKQKADLLEAGAPIAPAEITYEDLPDTADHIQAQDDAPDLQAAEQQEGQDLTPLEVFIERGKQHVAMMDAGKWLLCQDAADVAVVWGDSTLDDWANEVGIAGSTARHYRRMWYFFDNARRLAFEKVHCANPDEICWLKFSHYSQALILPNADIAYEWLAIVAIGLMPVDYAKVELDKWMESRGYSKRNPGKQPSKPEKVFVAKNLNVSGKMEFEQHDGEYYVRIRLQDEPDIIEAFKIALRAHKKHDLRLTIVQAG